MYACEKVIEMGIITRKVQVFSYSID